MLGAKLGQTIKILQKYDSHHRLDTVILRAFGHLKIPLLSYIKPKILVLDEEKLEILVPLNRRSKNHLGSMYFGALMIGADAAAGFYAAKLMIQENYPINFVFRDAKASFIKRPTADVLFSCDEGAKIRAALEKAMQTSERQDIPLTVVCSCPEIGSDAVAEIHLTLSIKKKKEKN